jgi:hypothetical protein
MNAFHTLIRRIDVLLQGHEAKNTIQEVRQEVTLRTKFYDDLNSWFVFRDLELKTGGSNLFKTHQMQATIKYKIDDTQEEMEITSVTYPNGKTSLLKSPLSTDEKKSWYRLTQTSKDIALPYFAQDTFDITPRNGPSDTIIHFHPPQ